MIHIQPKKVLYVLLSIALALVALHLATQYAVINWQLSKQMTDILQKFNLDEEVSIPTWYAQTLLLLVGAIVLPIATKAIRTADKYRYHWVGIVVAAVYMSMDEGAALHELLIEPMQERFDISSGPLFFAWLIPVGIIAVLLAIVYIRFWWQLPKHVRTTLVVAAVLFLVGSIGMEMISGDYWQANGFENNFTYRVFNAVEEGLEYIGVSLAAFAFLVYKKEHKDI